MTTLKTSNGETQRGLQNIIHMPLDHDLKHIKDTDCMRIELASENFEGCPPWFQAGNVKRIQVALGKEFAALETNLSNERKLIQEAVITEMLHHRHSYNRFYAKTVDKARHILKTQVTNPKSSTIIILYAHLNPHPFLVAKTYDLLTHECAQIHPTRSEFIFHDAKVYDLRALDAIARDMKSYRPITCYPGTTKCPLSRKTKTILKRNHSVGCQNIKIVKSKTGKPPCKRALPTELRTEQTHELEEEYFQVIHQEFVPSLPDNEFRVFIATRPGETGNVREPYVVLVIKTNWDKKDPPKKPSKKSSKKTSKTDADDVDSYNFEEYTAARVNPSDSWPDFSSLSYDDLQTFALEVYRRLQEHDPNGYDSLKVGARFDIGISPEGTQFFVNELTRWYTADHFALGTQDPPYDMICTAYAQAFADIFPAGNTSAVVEEPNSMAPGEKEAAAASTESGSSQAVQKAKPAPFMEEPKSTTTGKTAAAAKSTKSGPSQAAQKANPGGTKRKGGDTNDQGEGMVTRAKAKKTKTDDQSEGVTTRARAKKEKT